MSNAGEVMRPLQGKRILVTRTAAQAGALAHPLEALGATVVICPTIEIVPPDDPGELDRALAQLDQVDILILSSPNAVEIFFDRCRQHGLGLQWAHEISVIAVGPKTAAAIESHGVKVDRVPGDFRAEGLVDLLKEDVAGRCVLYPKAGLARDLLPRELAAAGATLLDPVAYTSRPPRDAAAQLTKAVAEKLDLLTFTASSTVRNLVKLLPRELAQKAQDIPVASIGPLTSQTARKLGFTVIIEPQDATLEALVDAIRIYFTNRPR